MPLLEDSIDTTKPFEETFGTDPVLDGINENDPLSSQTGNSGYGSEDELPTDNVVGENLPDTGVQNLSGESSAVLGSPQVEHLANPEGSESSSLVEPSSSDEGGDEESLEGKDPLTNEPLNSDTSSVLDDAEGDPLINPGACLLYTSDAADD